MLDAPHLYARPGNPYVTPEGVDWPDNGVRFAALSRIAADIGHGLVPAFVPDVVHAHDWQAGLAPAYLHYDNRPRPATVMTIHNMAFQGKFAPELIGSMGLPWRASGVNDLEYFGGISFLKAGPAIRRSHHHGLADLCAGDPEPRGRHGVRRPAARPRERAQRILNGIDVSVWNPQPIRTSPTASARRTSHPGPPTRRCFSNSSIWIRSDEAPLLGVISRLSWQKGLDLLLEAMPTILREGMQLALLGSGDRDLQDRYQAVARANPGRIGVVIGYDEIMAHLIQAGCGRAHRALAVRAVRPDPALRAALRRRSHRFARRRPRGYHRRYRRGRCVRPRCHRLQVRPVTADALAGTLRKANIAFHDKLTWRRLQLSGLATDVSWRNRAGDYAALYRGLMTGAHEARPSSNQCYRAAMDPFVIKLIGFAAATCTTVAYAPQAIKVWKTRSTGDISLGMFLVMVLGLALWLVYGLLSGDAPLIAANVITMVLAGGILFMKLKFG